MVVHSFDVFLQLDKPATSATKDRLACVKKIYFGDTPPESRRALKAPQVAFIGWTCFLMS
jgi:hypothetical protein